MIHDVPNTHQPVNHPASPIHAVSQELPLPTHLPKISAHENLSLVTAEAFPSKLGPPVALVVHGTGNFHEPGNVAASNQAGQLALGGRDVLLGRL